MNVMTAKLASVTAPLSRPKPTASSEEMAPAADSASSVLRPMRCMTGVKSVAQIQRSRIHTSMRTIGAKVINTFTIVMPNEMYGPSSGSVLERISLL